MLVWHKLDWKEIIFPKEISKWLKARWKIESKCPILRQEFEAICKENAELKGEAESVLDNWCRGADPCMALKKQDELLTNAKELLKWFVWYFKEGSSNLVPYKHKVKEVEQFLSELERNAFWRKNELMKLQTQHFQM